VQAAWLLHCLRRCVIPAASMRAALVTLSGRSRRDGWMSGSRSRSRQIGRHHCACELVLRCAAPGVHSGASPTQVGVVSLASGSGESECADDAGRSSLLQTELAQLCASGVTPSGPRKKITTSHLIAIAIARIVVTMLASNCSVVLLTSCLPEDCDCESRGLSVSHGLGR